VQGSGQARRQMSAARDAADGCFASSAALLDTAGDDLLIRTTANHPFYVRGRGWVPAEKLKIGDRFRGHDGDEVELVELVDSGVVEPVFNLQVADAHTYFVGGVESGCSVLVHNESPGDSNPTPSDSRYYSNDPTNGKDPRASLSIHISDKEKTVIPATDFYSATKEGDNLEIRYYFGNSPDLEVYSLPLNSLERLVRNPVEIAWLRDQAKLPPKLAPKIVTGTRPPSAGVASPSAPDLKAVKLDREDAKTAIKAYLKVVSNEFVDRVANGEWKLHPKDSDRFMHVMDLIEGSTNIEILGKFGNLLVFNSLTALGGPEYKAAVKLFKGVMEWADGHYDEDEGFDIIAGQVKSMVMKKIDKLQEEHIGPIAPDGVQGSIDKVTGDVKDKIADKLVEWIKEAVIAKHFGQGVTYDYPYRQNLGMAGGIQVGGQEAHVTFVITRYKNDTYNVVITGTYKNDPAAFQQRYHTQNNAFGSKAEFTVTQGFRMTSNGDAVLLGFPRTLKYTIK